MNWIKRIIPNSVKQEGKYYLYDLLKIPYNRVGVPVEITQWLPANTPPITYIDIGASRGKFSESLSLFYKIGKGLLIEPIPEVASGLKNAFGDAVIYKVLNIAISDNKGESEFYFSKELDVMSSLLKIREEFHDPFLMSSPGEKTVIQTDTLDNISAENNLGVIDLIKIDVQGAEHMVLSAAAETLKRTKMVYTEFSYRPLYDGSSTFFDVYNILNANNFRFVATETACRVNREIVQGDGLFVNNSFYP